MQVVKLWKLGRRTFVFTDIIRAKCNGKKREKKRKQSKAEKKKKKNIIIDSYVNRYIYVNARQGASSTHTHSHKHISRLIHE